jgi:glycosyltransferase involved in cell wall biosynthesis
MRIAFLSVSDQIGGSEAMLLEILAALGRSRPSWPLYVVLPGTGPLADRAAALGAHVLAVPMPVSLSRLGDWGVTGRGKGALALKLLRAAADLPAYEGRLRGVLSAIGPDVLHTNGFKAHIVGARARRLCRGLVWHVHEYVGNRPMTRKLVRRYARRASSIVANSESVAADVRRIAGAHAGVRVIYNAVDRAPAGTVRVGLVATFSRWKGHETFLRALAALPPRLPVRGYVIGGALYDTDGSQHSAGELRAFAASLGLEGRVGFTGFVGSVDGVMRALDVVVHASTMPEPFGLVIAEAMGCGRAVITSGTGGAGELVRDGVDAVTHRPGDMADLASRIEMLAADAPLRARLGRAAREAAGRRFDAARLAEEFASTYEAAAEGAMATR